MKNVKNGSNELGIEGQATPEQFPESPLPILTKTPVSSPLAAVKLEVILKKLRGGILLVIGYLLSPLSFWNDLFFNLPIAYGFGYICSLLSPDLLLPCSIIGYWISNIAGILLMQLGAVDVFQEQPKERKLKKELLMGLASSVAYTLLILVLIHFKVLDSPVLLSVIQRDN